MNRTSATWVWRTYKGAGFVLPLFFSSRHPSPVPSFFIAFISELPTPHRSCFGNNVNMKKPLSIVLSAGASPANTPGLGHIGRLLILLLNLRATRMSIVNFKHACIMNGDSSRERSAPSLPTDSTEGSAVVHLSKISSYYPCLCPPNPRPS